jgi:hypothetical protein
VERWSGCLWVCCLSWELRLIGLNPSRLLFGSWVCLSGSVRLLAGASAIDSFIRCTNGLGGFDKRLDLLSLCAHCLTIGSSDRGNCVFGEPRRELMIGINQLHFSVAQSRVAQPNC